MFSIFLNALLPLFIGVLWEQYTFYSFIWLHLSLVLFSKFLTYFHVRLGNLKFQELGIIKLALAEVAADGKMPWLTFSFSVKNFWHFTASWQTASSPYLRKCGAELNKGCLCTGAEKCIICKLVENSVPSFLATKPV